MRLPFILSTVAFKPCLICDCFMFAEFWKAWSQSLGGQLPSTPCLACLLGKGCGLRACGTVASSSTPSGWMPGPFPRSPLDRVLSWGGKTVSYIPTLSFRTL